MQDWIVLKLQMQIIQLLYSINGIEENDILAVGDKKTLTITVSYDSNITTQPDILSSTLTVTLDFVQS